MKFWKFVLCFSIYLAYITDKVESIPKNRNRYHDYHDPQRMSGSVGGGNVIISTGNIIGSYQGKPLPKTSGKKGSKKNKMKNSLEHHGKMDKDSEENILSYLDQISNRPKMNHRRINNYQIHDRNMNKPENFGFGFGDLHKSFMDQLFQKNYSEESQKSAQRRNKYKKLLKDVEHYPRYRTSSEEAIRNFEPAMLKDEIFFKVNDNEKIVMEILPGDGSKNILTNDADKILNTLLIDSVTGSEKTAETTTESEPKKDETTTEVSTTESEKTVETTTENEPKNDESTTETPTTESEKTAESTTENEPKNEDTTTETTTTEPEKTAESTTESETKTDETTTEVTSTESDKTAETTTESETKKDETTTEIPTTEPEKTAESTTESETKTDETTTEVTSTESDKTSETTTESELKKDETTTETPTTESEKTDTTTEESTTEKV